MNHTTSYCNIILLDETVLYNICGIIYITLKKSETSYHLSNIMFLLVVSTSK